MTWDWIWANMGQIALIVSPAITLTMWAVHSTFPSRAALRRAMTAMHERVDREIATLDGRLDGAHQRILKIEAQMQTLATREDVGRVLIALERQDGERKALETKIEGIRGELAAVRRPLDLIQEHLLNRAGP